MHGARRFALKPNTTACATLHELHTAVRFRRDDARSCFRKLSVMTDRWVPSCDNGANLRQMTAPPP
jgi:hypothetical protein